MNSKAATRVGLMRKRGLIYKVKSMGQIITVYNNWNTEDENQFEIKGLIEKQKKPGQLNIQVLERENVMRNSVVQPKGSQDLYAVIDTRDNVEGETLVSFEIFAEKIDQSGSRIWAQRQGQNVFNAPIEGGVQIGGSENRQEVSINSRKEDYE